MQVLLVLATTLLVVTLSAPARDNNQQEEESPDVRTFQIDLISWFSRTEVQTN